MNTRVWVDTSFLYALFVRSDTHHVQAQELWRERIKRKIPAVTSNLVFSELATLFVYRFGHAIALSRMGLLCDSALVRRVYADAAVESSAMHWWKKFGDQKFSFPDCVSFEFMRRLGVGRALSYDLDFSIAGFEVLQNADQMHSDNAA